MDKVTMVIMAFIAVIPSAVVGFMVWSLERKIQKRDDAERADRDKRKQYELCQLNMTVAAVALSEATARAVQRIPDAHCNGDMTKALNYAEQIKNEQRDFLRAAAVDSLEL